MKIEVMFKGKCHKIFGCWFFHQIASAGPISPLTQGIGLVCPSLKAYNFTAKRHKNL